MTTALKHSARLGDLLVARDVITEAQLTHALETLQECRQEKLLGEILVDLGYASAEQVLSAVAEACGVPFARLTPELVDPEVRSTLPAGFMQKHAVLPLFRVRNVLTVAVAEPADVFLVDEIVLVAGMNVQVVAATADNIFRMLEQTRTEGPAAAAVPEAPEDELPSYEGLLQPEDYESVYGNWPPEKVAGLLVREAVRSRASAIHLEPDEKVLRIRFRTDGVLHVVMRPPARLAAGLAAAFDDMTGSSGSAASGPALQRSGRLLVHGRPVQLHVASMGGVFGPRTVVGLVRDSEARRNLEKLGFDFELLARYREWIPSLRGLVVVAGPRDSGVTTALYSTLNDLDPVRLNICTLESCIGFHLPGINQFSPATCGAADPADALAALLLHQPDVLMLDGVMEGQVVPAAVDAAMNGCFVLAGVRALDAADALARLAAHVPAGELLSALRGILVQRLVRTVCPHCKTSYEPSAAQRRQVAQALGSVDGFIRGRGCAACRHTGCLGRIGLFELVAVEDELADALRTGGNLEVLRAAISAADRPSLWTDGVNKIRAGITSVEQVTDALTGYPGRVSPFESVSEPSRR